MPSPMPAGRFRSVVLGPDGALYAAIDGGDRWRRYPPLGAELRRQGAASERPVEISDEIFGILQPHGQPKDPVAGMGPVALKLRAR